MTSHRASRSELFSGAVSSSPRGDECAELEVIPRYFVGANVVLNDGKHAMLALTPYLYTLATAERALEERRADFPKAAILWTFSVFDLRDEGERQEAAEVNAAGEEERRSEGYS